MIVAGIVSLYCFNPMQFHPYLTAIPDPTTFHNPYSRQTRAINLGLSRGESELIGQLLNQAAPEFGTGTNSNGFDTDERTLRKLCFLVTNEVLKPEFDMPGVSDAASIQKQLDSGVSKICAKYQITIESPLAERLRAQAYADWTRTRVVYDQTYFTMWDEQRKREGDQSKFVLSWQPRRGVCGGIQVTFRDLARAGGIKCTMITCQTRGPGHKNSPNANHTIVIAHFKNGLNLPVDCSSCTIASSDAVKMSGAIHSFWALPISKNELAMHIAYRHHFNEMATSFGDKQNVFKFSNSSVEQWRQWNVNTLDRFEPKPLPDSGFYWGK